MNHRTFCWHQVLLTLLVSAVTSLKVPAQDIHASPVNRSHVPETISTDFGLADGPAWDGRALYVPDVKRFLIKRYVPGNNQWHTLYEGTVRYSASFFSHGRLFVANSSMARIEAFAGNRSTSKPETVFTVNSSEDPQKRPNDLVVDHHGGIYLTLTRQNQVIYVSPNGDSRVVSDAVQAPNGIVLSPDNQTLYVAAYRVKKIIAFPVVAPGQCGEGSDFATMTDGDAPGADGMTVDRAGNVYCAGPADIWIWSPSGKLLDKIACPTRPINCAFGDSDMRSLYITAFGGIYRQRMKISGLAPQPPVDTSLVQGDTIPDTSIPEHITAWLSVPYAEYNGRRVLADIFAPTANKTPCPAIVVIHGGGWLKGDRNKFRALAVDLADRGFVTAAIEYRLGDEAAFPAAAHDCSAAIRFLRAHADTYHVDPERIAAVGGSAGGHLAGLMATGWNNSQLSGPGGPANQSSRIQLAIVMAGPLQMTTGSVARRSRTSHNSNANRWLRKTIDEAPELYALADAHLQISKDTCPIWFLAGELDNPERNKASRERLKELGIPTGLITYSDGKHGCWNREPWFSRFADDIERLMRQQLK